MRILVDTATGSVYTLEHGCVTQHAIYATGECNLDADSGAEVSKGTLAAHPELAVRLHAVFGDEIEAPE